MSIQKIPLNPGVYKDDTPLDAEGFFIDSNKIRFLRGAPQTIGGWELVSPTALTGKVRGLCGMADINLIKWLFAGTHTNLYGLTDSIPYDITPVVSRGNVSINFTTVITSAVVTADWTAHGLVVGQAFRFTSATVSPIGGVTIPTAAISATVPSPWYIVLTAPTANQITFTAAQAASASAGPTSSVVNFEQYLAPGLGDGIGALGYGTGLYSGAFTYSTPSTGITYCRTWSMTNYGVNFMCSPRGGKLYEFAPIVTQTELVTNGTFTGSAAGWTLGANWAYGANAVTATASSASMTQSVTVPANAFCLLSVDSSAWSTGVVQVQYNGATVISSIASNTTSTGTFFSAGGANTLSFNATNATVTIDNVSIKQLLTAEVVPNAPTQNTCMVVTPEGFVMVGGTIELATGNFNPLHVRCSDIGTTQQGEQIWTPSATNQSTKWTLLVGSRIVGMKIGNNEVLIWTDRALYAATFASNTSIVYSMRLVGTHCGLIGPNAAAILGGVAFWMSPTGQIFTYSGGVPTPVKSTMSKWVFDNISLIQQDKIFASAISGFQDVIWLYPDQRDGIECSRYTLFDTNEQAPQLPGTVPGIVGVFANGTFDRTAWIDAGANVSPYPVAADSSGYLYYHEKGTTANGGTFSWSLQTGALEIGNGITQYMIDTFIPDFANFLGGASLTANSYLWPQSTPVVHGPFMFTSGSEQVSLLNDAPMGRQVALTFTGSASPAQMRTGHLAFDLQDTGMAF